MKYVANPVEVDAKVIKEIRRKRYKSAVPDDFILTLDDGSEFICEPGMVSRMEPKAGDYLVTQSDGYIYLNPKDVFERKYSPMTETSELVHRFLGARDALVTHISGQFDKAISKTILEDLIGTRV